MAHSLRLISNKGYNCYGDGRDWFFLGDPEFRNGRRTPVPNQTGPALIKPAPRPRGVTREVSYQRAVSGAKGRKKEKWQKICDERPQHFGPQQSQVVMDQEQLARTTGGKGARLRGNRDGNQAATFATTYDQLGQHPAWKGPRYHLEHAEMNNSIGVPRSSSEPVLKEMEGDHTRGIRGARPHFSSTYQQVGLDVPGMPANRCVVANAENLRDACVPPKVVPPKDIEGDNCQGIKGPLGSAPMRSTLSDYGHEQPFPKWMGDRKHQHPLCEELRDAGAIPIQEKPKEVEGDHSRGIRGATAHHFTTSGDYARYQKIEGKRRDFGPVARTQYRLTTWS